MTEAQATALAEAIERLIIEVLFDIADLRPERQEAVDELARALQESA